MDRIRRSCSLKFLSLPSQPKRKPFVLSERELLNWKFPLKCLFWSFSPCVYAIGLHLHKIIFSLKYAICFREAFPFETNSNHTFEWHLFILYFIFNTWRTTYVQRKLLQTDNQLIGSSSSNSRALHIHHFTSTRFNSKLTYFCYSALHSSTRPFIYYY